MKKFLRFSLVALFAVLGMSNAMAEDIIWSEDFSDYAAGDVPSGGTYSYVCTNGGNNGSTKIYSEASAGGTAPELLVAKSNGTFSATIPLNGKSGEMTLIYKTNKTIVVSSTTTGVTISDISKTGNDCSYTITVPAETESIELVFTNTSGKTTNARLDNIKLYQGTAKTQPGITWGKASATVTFGNPDDTYKYIPTLQNPNELSVTCTSSDESVATVTNAGVVSVVGVGDATITATFAGNDEYDAAEVSFDLKVNPNKTNAELAFSSEEITITLGETFTAPTLSNPHAVEVVYSSSKTEVAEVDATTGEVTIKAAGTTKITAKVPSTNEEYDGSASYTINVNEPAGTDISNTPETAYTVAKAYELIDAGDGLSTEVYVKGIISQIDKFDDKDKYITYWISDDGTTTKQFECYHGKGLNGADFTALTDLKVGATVVVKGTLKKFKSTYEFDAGNVLFSYDESTAGEQVDISNTPETAYTVAKAVELIEDGKGLATEVYVKGIITKVESFNETYHSIAYWISDDGTETSQQFEVYGGLAKEGEEFSSKDDLAVGGKVVVKGILKKFTKGEETIYEMDKNNHLISYEAPATGISALTIDTDANAPMYNLKGERVDANYRGVVIKGGKKIIQK